MSIEKSDLFELFADLKKYLNTRYELVVLKTVDKSSKIISGVSLYLIIFVIVFFLVLFSSIAFALYLSEYYASVYKGFFAISIIYFSLLVVVLLFKSGIKRKITNMMIRGIFENLKDE